MANKIQFVITAVDRATSTVRKVKGSIASTFAPVTALGKSLASLSRETGLSRLVRGLTSATRAAGGLLAKITMIATPLGLLGGLGSIAGLASIVTSWGRAGQEIDRTSTLLGINTQQLQQYRGVARLAGLSTDSMDASLQALGDTMQGAVNGRAPETLALMSAWQIGLHRTADGAVDVSRAMLDVSRAIRSNLSAGGNIQSARQIAQAFGVESLLPLLIKGPSAIQDLVRQFDNLHATMDPSAIRQAEEYAQNIAKLELSVVSLKDALGNALIPVLQPAIELMSQWLAVPENKQKLIDGVAGAVRFLSDEIKSFDWEKAKRGASDFFDLVSRSYEILMHVAHLGSRVGTGFERFGNALRGNGLSTNDELAAGVNGNTTTAIEYFQSRGWSRSQAIGIVANLQRESQVDPTAVGDNGQAYGIAQWHKDRQAAFQKWAGNWIGNSTLEQQLGFVDYELRNGGVQERAAGSALANASTPEQAADIVSRLYERPGAADSEAAARSQFAGQLSGLYGGGPTVAAANQPGADSTQASLGPGEQVVKVDINLQGAPRGTRTSVSSSRNVDTNVRTGKTMDLGAAL
ncbi:Putative membrane protein, phage K related protein [Paraburkholderia caribensis]|uniref:phage tail tip lysozyme n=1 Tax=Paraburkholderia caribensis TaxID=75105 RepID=UPI001CAACF33|nr:phage tail tip lysozyme [Paraburkholderia caribensis]CAG9194293.1 Putative membrane protein, phage K related protein [Paraburkholderia caribensis]